MKKNICILLLLFSFILMYMNSEVYLNMGLKNEFKKFYLYKDELFERYVNYKNNNSDLSIDEVILRVNSNLDYKFYEKKFNALNKNTPLILVNKYYYLEETYIPDNLTLVSLDYALKDGVYVCDEVLSNFKNLKSDALSVGLNIKIVSAYRSYYYQKDLYENYLQNDSVEIVDTYSARPGHSEHQTGYAIDISNVILPYTSFGSTKEFEWVKINAHKYGFIIRYKSEFSYITGYKDEPWHLRYVGTTAAKEIYENNISLEEYLQRKK